MRATRRDYLDFVRLVRRLEKGTTRRLMWGIALADILERSNPKFDKKMFIDACAAEMPLGNVVEFADRQREK